MSEVGLPDSSETEAAEVRLPKARTEIVREQLLRAAAEVQFEAEFHSGDSAEFARGMRWAAAIVTTRAQDFGV